MDKLYDRCFGYLCMYSLICFIVIAVLIVLLIILGVKHKKFDKKDYCLLGLCFACFLGAFVFFGSKWITMHKDYKLIENDQYEVVTGRVVGYHKSQYFENGSTEYSWPIIEETGTNDRITLDVGNTELNKTYTIYYLQYSKLGIVAEEH